MTPRLVARAALALAGLAAWGPAAGAAKVELLPPAGTIVRIGEAVEVRFSVEGAEGVEGAVLRVGAHVERIEGTGPFVYVYVPSGFAGVVAIEAETFGAAGEMRRASSSLLVKPSQPFTRIHGENPLFELTVGERKPLRVFGVAADATETEITGADAGTTYRVQSGGSNVISIGGDGMVEARGAGSELIVFRNGDLSAAVRAAVTAVNHPPKIADLKPVTAIAGDYAEAHVQATDPDGDVVVLSSANLPEWTRLTNVGGGHAVIELRPKAADVGTHVIRLLAVDDGQPRMSDTAELTVVVKAP